MVKKALWKEGVLVDFDRSVNICVNQLRKAFPDDPRTRRYLERRTWPAIVVLVLRSKGAMRARVTGSEIRRTAGALCR